MIGWINSKSRDEFRSLPQTRTMSFSPRNDFSSCKVLLYDEACCWLFSFKQGFLILLISGPNAPSSTISIMDFLYIEKILFQPYFFYFVTLFLLQFINKQHHIFNTLFIFFQEDILDSYVGKILLWICTLLILMIFTSLLSPPTS